MGDIQVIKLIEKKGVLQAILRFDSDDFCINCECKVVQGDYVTPGDLLFYVTVRRRFNIVKQEVLANHPGKILWVNTSKVPREGDRLFAIELQANTAVSTESKKVDGFEPEPCKYGLTPNNYNFSSSGNLNISDFDLTSKKTLAGLELVNLSRISGRIVEQELINSLCSRVEGDSSDLAREIAGLLDVIDGWASSFYICEEIKDEDGSEIGGFVSYGEKVVAITFNDPNSFLELIRHEVHHIIQFEHGLNEIILGIDVYDQAIAAVIDSELYKQNAVDGLIMEFESYTIERIPFMAINIYKALKKGVPIEDTIYAATKSRIKTIRWCAQNRSLPIYSDSPTPFSFDLSSPDLDDSAEVASQAVSTECDDPFFNATNFSNYKALAIDSGIEWSSRCQEVPSMGDTPHHLELTPYGMLLNHINQLGEEIRINGTLLVLPHDPCPYEFQDKFSDIFGTHVSWYMIKFSDKHTYRNLHSVEASILGLHINCSNVIAKRFSLERYIAWDRLSWVSWHEIREGDYIVETDFFQIEFSCSHDQSAGFGAYADSRKIYIELMHWSAFSKWLLGYPSRPTFNSPASPEELYDLSMLDVFEEGYPLTMAIE